MAQGFGIVGIPKRGGGPLVKPGPDAVIDWQHPLAQGLVRAYTFRSYHDTARLIRSTEVGGGALSLTTTGLSCDGANYLNAGKLQTASVADFTVVTRLQFAAASTRYCICGNNTFGHGSFRLERDQFNRLTFSRYITTDRSVVASASSSTQQNAAAVHISTVGGEIFRDGVSVGTDANTGALAAGTSASDFRVADDPRINIPFAGTIEYLHIHFRALGLASIVQLHAEPYCFFWERRKTIFVPVGAAPPAATPRSFGYIIA